MKPVNSLPATVTTVLGAAAALVIAFGHLSAANAAVVTSLAAALGTVVMVIAGAINGKPVSMQAVTGAATVIFADLALFGLHMDPDQRGALAGAVTVALGMIFHLLHITVATVPLKASAVTTDPALAKLAEREEP